MLMSKYKLVAQLKFKSLTSNRRYKGKGVVLDNKLMAESGLVIAVAIKLPLLKVIIVDDNFYNFSKSTQEFILAHEYGHLVDDEVVEEPIWIKNQHRLDATENGLVVREEAFADDYGVATVGLVQSIAALKDIRDALPIFFSRDEVTLRIERLMDKLN